MDVTNGEILAMASLPSYDANNARTITNESLFNRATLGVYEQGSMFKVFNTALALDSGKFTMNDRVDASSPIKIDRFTIHDDPDVPHRVLTVPEVFTYSSNIGSAKMAVEVGSEAQRAFFNKLGFLKQLNTELPELGTPLWPRQWAKISTMTIAFGHGMSVSPLHLTTGVAAIINGGILHSPTFVKRAGPPDPGQRVIQAKTSALMRQLMRLNVIQGTGKKSEVKGYEVGGKTGTAEKVGHGGGYAKKALFSSFVAVFPMSDPKFLVLVSLDEPKGLPETGGYATGGMVSAPSVKVIIENIISLYGILPGDWTQTPLEIASTPMQPQAPAVAPVFAATVRGRVPERRALPARAGGQAAVAPGVRRVAVE
jgi:cell division protein FtsI (penicillin-binding protein 3)